MKVLGIHDGHSASAALIEDGRIIAAVQEERLTRHKNQGGFPGMAVADVLGAAGIALADIDHIAFCGYGKSNVKTREDILRNYYRKVEVPQRGRLAMFGRRLRPEFVDQRKRERRLARRRQERIAPLLELGAASERIQFVEHHDCHAATAYYGQPERGEELLVLTCDGAGDGLCATVSIAKGGIIRRLASVPQSESVAMIYSFLTYLMGFVPLEHEYKLMGLAPYSDSSERAEKVCRDLLAMFRFSDDAPLGWQRSPGVEDIWQAGPRLKRYIEYKRFDELAGGLQKFIERFILEWVTRCMAHTGIRRLALSGGLFMNVKLNKLIMEMPDVDSMFVFPSCGDETNSIGAAWAAYLQAAGGDAADIAPLGPFYLGGDFDNAEVREDIEAYDFKKRVRVVPCDDIEKRCATLLAEGQVVARCKGRMEFGARSLGNRTILANPNNWRAVREINEMIKMRDFWMPFAPSMLASDAERYISNPKGLRAPYMILAFDTRKEKLDAIVAATHPYDESCRPQIVEESWNPDYHRLISEFKALTGEGVVLNTSLNLHGLPMVYRPVDALHVFDNSGLRYLALGDIMIEQVDA